MQVYFSASRYYKDKFASAYLKIIEALKESNCKVLDNTSKILPEGKIEMSEDQKSANYERILKWINKCDFSVFEASFPSTLHIGHEITVAIEKGKPVIVLYQNKEGAEPMLFRGIKSDKVIWVEYGEDNVKEVLSGAIEKAKEIQDVRFNFFVSPKILNYLDWIAKKRRIPRSVFLRNLIEKEMKKDKDFA